MINTNKLPDTLAVGGRPCLLPRASESWPSLPSSQIYKISRQAPTRSCLPVTSFPLLFSPLELLAIGSVGWLFSHFLLCWRRWRARSSGERLPTVAKRARRPRTNAQRCSFIKFSPISLKLCKYIIYTSIYLLMGLANGYQGGEKMVVFSHTPTA